MTPAQRGWSGAGGCLAALTAFGLGILAGVMMVAGHAPWEGPQVVSLSETHGIHEGDVFALVPVIIGALLAWWCLTRPSYAQVTAIMEAGIEARDRPDDPGRRGRHD